MAFGDNPVDESLRDAWHDFCDEVKAAGDHVFKDISGSSDGERTNAEKIAARDAVAGADGGAGDGEHD